MIDWKKLANSFRYAFRGASHVAREEQNFRIELAVGAVVVVLMFVFDLAAVERAALVLAIVLVLVLELINSIFERLADLLKPRIHQYVEDVKDIMAGTVLAASVGALIIGGLIFWPHVAALLR